MFHELFMSLSLTSEYLMSFIISAGNYFSRLHDKRSENPISILRSLFCINNQQLKRRYEFVIGCKATKIFCPVF